VTEHRRTGIRDRRALVVAALAGLLAVRAAPAQEQPSEAQPAPATAATPAAPAAPASPATPPTGTPASGAADRPRAGKVLPTRALSIAELLAASKPSEWQPLEPESTLYMELATGRVVIALAPEFAPRHVENIRKLARAHWYDGLAITRVQDNFVTQWGDPLNSTPEVGEKRLPAEMTRPAAGLGFRRLSDPDSYAPEVGFVGPFPAARSAPGGEAWAVHCYGTVGVGRDNDPAGAIGTELYAVIGHAPRQLDRNATVVGRVVKGIELLSALPRGTGDLGFYDQPEQRVPIQSIRVAAELPAAERTPLELLRSDSLTFARIIEVRRNRRDAWYKVSAGRIDVCNVPLPVREASGKPADRGERRRG
jgi:peptidylprolyl isomerase